MKSARQWMAIAVQTAPDDLRSRVGYALWLTEQGHYDEANDQATAAAKLTSDSIEIQRLQGSIARLRKDYAAAEHHLEAVYRKLPDDGQVCNLLALVLAEQADEAKGKRALQLATVNARQFPDSQDALATLGWVYFKAGRTEEAEKVLSKAASGRQVSSDVAYMCARVLIARGSAEEARGLLRSALGAPGVFLCRQEAEEALKGLGALKTP
jgi:tetratricopeptide (TPR) repeat protein